MDEEFDCYEVDVSEESTSIGRRYIIRSKYTRPPVRADPVAENLSD